MRALQAYGTPTTTVLAYADDMVLIANDAALLQRMLGKVERMAARIALSFNPNKSKTLHVRPGPTVQNSTYMLTDCEVPRATDIADTTIFSGIPVGFSTISDNASLREINRPRVSHSVM